MSILTRSTTSRATRCGCAPIASMPRRSPQPATAATSTSSCTTAAERSCAASRSSDATASTPGTCPCRTTPRATTPCAPTRSSCEPSRGLPLPQAPARGRPAKRRKIPARGAPARALRRILLPRRGLSGQRSSLPRGLQGTGRRRTPALLGGVAARRQGPLHRLPAHTPCGHRQRGVLAPRRTALRGRVPRPGGTPAPLRTPRGRELHLRAARRPHRLDLRRLHPFGTQLAAARTAARGAPLRHAVLQQGVGSAGANAHLPPRGAARGAVSSAAPRRSDGQGPLRAAGLQPRRRSPPPASRDDGAR